MKFSENLIKLRKERGMSQESLGEIADVSRQTVSKWELGETTPEMAKLMLLADYFKITVDELIGRDSKSEIQMNESGRYGYEYKSRREFRGLPLVHVKLNKPGKAAKGVIAVGNRARGIVAIGGMAIGVISVGGLSAGLLSLGGLSLGLLASLGGVSIGAIALGGVAIGIVAVGGCAIGVYAAGGLGLAQKIAYGDTAIGKVAIGSRMKGDIEIDRDTATAQQIVDLIKEKLPDTPKIITGFFSLFGK